MIEFVLDKLISDRLDNYYSNEEYNIVNGLTGGYPETEYYFRGRYTMTIKPEKIDEVCPEMKLLYPKKYTTLKIFRQKVGYLDQMCKIQNIYFLYGLSTKIYNLVKVDEYFAQITDFIVGDYCYDRAPHVHKLIHNVAEDNYIHCSCDVWPSNIINGLWIDFDKFKFDNFSRYRNKTIMNYEKNTFFGNSKNGPYQPSIELEVKGLRDDSRVKLFKLADYDFYKKTVLDIGCSGGYFVNYCANRGARAIGVDTINVTEAAYSASNISGVFGAEYYHFDLKNEAFLEFLYNVTGLKEFDYVFFLSVDQHIGFKEYLKDITKGVLFFESNGGKESDEEYKIFNEKLNSMFPIVEHLGCSKEGATRNLFIARRN